MAKLFRVYGFVINYDEESKTYEIWQNEDQLGLYHIYLSRIDVLSLKTALETILEEDNG